MIRYNKRQWVLAALLSAIAGYVDALGFLKLGGFFVSFMSGNSTRAGVGVAQTSEAAVIAGSLIVCFVVGVVAASLLGSIAGKYRRSGALGFVALLLTVAALCDLLYADRVAIAAMAAAMGAENTVFERDGEVSIGLTYMTGALVKAGQHIASAVMGGPHFGWVPYVMLWVGLVAGAVAGATVYPLMELRGLWIAAALMALVAAFFVRRDRASH